MNTVKLEKKQKDMRLDMYLKEIKKTVAYWISPRGEVLPVAINHIDSVIKNPEKFGYTTKKIEDMYDKYQEPVGMEGKAREQIIVDLIKKGFIRIRKYGNEGYSLNIGKLNKKVKDILYDWANKLINTGINGMKEKDVYSDVHISGFSDGTNINMSMKDIINDKLFEDNESFNSENAVIIVESAEDFTYEPRLLDNLR